MEKERNLSTKSGPNLISDGHTDTKCDVGWWFHVSDCFSLRRCLNWSAEKRDHPDVTTFKHVMVWRFAGDKHDLSARRWKKHHAGSRWTNWLFGETKMTSVRDAAASSPETTRETLHEAQNINHWPMNSLKFVKEFYFQSSSCRSFPNSLWKLFKGDESAENMLLSNCFPPSETSNSFYCI